MPTATPRLKPTTTPMAKPAIVVQNVCNACCEIGLAYSTRDLAIWIGLGKIKSDTLKIVQTACHTTRIASDSNHGAHFSSRNCCS